MAKAGYLWLTYAQAETIARHASDESPHEVCGLIGGYDAQAIEIVPVPNVDHDPIHRFTMDERVLAQTLLRFYRAGLELIAVYHSHPESLAIPSATDIAEAYYPEAAYLIVSLKDRHPLLNAWHIEGASVRHVEVVVSNTPPDARMYTQLSQAQKVAIVIAMITALIVLIVWSIELLPPAPPIPVATP